MFPSLLTPRLHLRPIRPDDQATVFAGLSHPDVIRYYGVSYQTFEETAAQMDWYARLDAEQTGRWWAVTNPETGEFLGACGLNNWVKGYRKAELGYWLLPPHWGRGLMREAVAALLDHAVSDMNLHRVEASVEDGNAASSTLLTALGFSREGRLVDCEIKHGAFISLTVFAKIFVN